MTVRYDSFYSEEDFEIPELSRDEREDGVVAFGAWALFRRVEWRSTGLRGT